MIQNCFSKQTIKNCLTSAMAGIVCLAAGTTITGCSDDFANGFPEGDLGEKVYATVSVDFGSEKATVVSRALDFNDDAQIKIDSYWVGLFDTRTGELIGSKYDEKPRKTDGTRYTLKSTSGTVFTAEDIDIYYYDHNPEAYIVGVINYNGVSGKMAGDNSTSDLLSLLDGVRSFEEFCKISVDTKSVDAANPTEKSGWQETPLMMGFYTANPTELHTTVTSDGGISSNQKDVKIRLTPGDKTVTPAPGAIQLQRLIAELNVIVWAERGMYISNVEYKVVNNPGEVFLAEHATDINAAKRTSKDDFLAHTANSADFTGNYYSQNDFIPTEWYQDWDDYNYKFSFSVQHYENKHWGDNSWSNIGGTPEPGEDAIPSTSLLTKHAIREAKYDKRAENPVFKSLCSAVDQPWNNNASYIILKIDYELMSYDIDWGIDNPNEWDYQYGPVIYGTTERTGTAYYTIHEGYICSADGSVTSNIDTKALDYQTIRNTSYTYEIRFRGLNDLFMNVHSDQSGIHNDGVTGSLWDFSDFYVSPRGGIVGNTFFHCTPEERRNIKFIYFQPDYKGMGDPYDIDIYGTLPEVPKDAPDMFKEIDSVMFKPFREYVEVKSPDSMPEKLKNAIKIVSDDGSIEMTLIDYINSTDPRLDDPDNLFRLKFEPFEAESYAHDYVRYFMLYYTDGQTDADGCAVRDKALYLTQPVWDKRPYFPYMEPLRSDYRWVGFDNNNISAPWSGSKMTVTYVTWKMEDFDPADFVSTPEFDPLEMEYELRYYVRNSESPNQYSNPYEYKRFKGKDYYDYDEGVFKFPLYIGPWDYVGSLNIDIDPIFTEEISEYWYPSGGLYRNIFIQDVKYESAGRSDNWIESPENCQWIFKTFDESFRFDLLDFNPFYDFYKAGNGNASLEYCGFTIVNRTSGTAYRPITAPNYNRNTYIQMGGAGTFNSNPAQDKLVYKFTVDRPGKIQIFYTNPNTGTGRIMIQAREVKTGNILYTSEVTVNPEDNGQLCDFLIDNDNGFSWGTSGKSLPGGPVEIGIYSGSGAMALHSVRFWAYDREHAPYR